MGERCSGWCGSQLSIVPYTEGSWVQFLVRAHACVAGSVPKHASSSPFPSIFTNYLSRTHYQLASYKVRCAYRNGLWVVRQQARNKPSKSQGSATRWVKLEQKAPQGGNIIMKWDGAMYEKAKKFRLCLGWYDTVD